MTDPYSITDTAEAPRTAKSKGGVLRVLLWLVLAVSAAGNVVTSSMKDVNIMVGIGFGLVTLSCGIALAVQHYRHRR
jgi:hypothetical protein